MPTQSLMIFNICNKLITQLLKRARFTIVLCDEIIRDDNLMLFCKWKDIDFDFIMLYFHCKLYKQSLFIWDTAQINIEFIHRQ